ncbi:MAG: hypothetical protein EA001_06340 [Oscillatoriales cyanobacterium]|nr:MAG: hypothetical protein EA001_06340 [Oscillatoriales cyanobacterium]
MAVVTATVRSMALWQSIDPRQPIRWSWLWAGFGALAIGLAGCAGPGWGGPPAAIIRRAVALQLLQTQVTLVQQLGESSLSSGRSISWANLPIDVVITADDLDVATVAQVDRLRIEQRTAIAIAGRPGWQVVGRYRWRGRGQGGDRHGTTSSKTASQPASGQQSFEVYLQRQSEGKTWRLARLDSGRSTPDQPAWQTYRL